LLAFVSTILFSNANTTPIFTLGEKLITLAGSEHTKGLAERVVQGHYALRWSALFVCLAKRLDEPLQRISCNTSN
jgi:hypothetical protein